MMRSTSREIDRLLAQLALLIAQVMASTMLPTWLRSCGRPGCEARRLVAGPDHDVGGRLDLRHLVAVLHALVAGEVEHLRARRRASARPIENSTALPRPPPASSTVSPPGVSVGWPVGPMRITGSPGFSSDAEIGRAAHLQHDDARPARAPTSTQAPVSARPSMASVVPSTRCGERLEILQAVELAGLEVARGLRRLAPPPRRWSASAG